MRTEDIKADLLRRAGGTLNASDAARMLGLDVVALRELAAEGAVISLPMPGGPVYPTCQLEVGGLVPGLADALRAMPVRSPWMRLEWLLTPSDALRGASPLEALRHGHLVEVIEVARSHSAE